MSGNAPARPSSASHSCTSRMPGLSMRIPPPGRSTSCRRVVVCLPAPSARTAPVARSWSSPASVFTRVDFPAPEGPRRAPVTPPPRYVRTGSRPLRRSDRDRVDGQLGPDPGEVVDDRGRARLEIGLREQEHRPRTALEGEGHVALEEESVEFVAERHDDEDHVDVRSDHLFTGSLRCARLRRATRESRPPRNDGLDDVVGAERDPVAHHGKLGRRGRLSQTRGDPCADLALGREDVVCASVLRGDPAWCEVVTGQRDESGVPVGVPAERCELHRRILPHRLHDEGRRAAPNGRPSVDFD